MAAEEADRTAAAANLSRSPEQVVFGGIGMGLELAGTLEGLLEEPPGKTQPPSAGGMPTGSTGSMPTLPAGGLVFAHPHPLYGGTLRQPLVHHVTSAARGAGFSTLRFNFRGVGRSAGSFDGRAERDDVRAATRFMRRRLPPSRPLVLGGFSFGSIMTAAAVIAGEPADALVLVALVIRSDEFDEEELEGLRRFGGPVLAICGEEDTLAPPNAVEPFLRSLDLDLTFEVLPRADHMFNERQREVGKVVKGFLARRFGGPNPGTAGR